MESSDDEIIDNNNDEGDFDIKLPESKAIKSNKIQIKPNPKPTNDIPKANTQVKNVSIASLSLKQSPKSKQIISVSIVNPKNAQTIKKNSISKLNNNNIPKTNNNPFRNPETKPKFKSINEVYQEVKNDIDIANNNNVLMVKKESNNIKSINNSNKIKKNKIESIKVKNKNSNNNLSEVGNNIIKKIDKINEEFLSNTFINSNDTYHTIQVKNNNNEFENKINNEDVKSEKYNMINYSKIYNSNENPNKTARTNRAEENNNIKARNNIPKPNININKKTSNENNESAVEEKIINSYFSYKKKCPRFFLCCFISLISSTQKLQYHFPFGIFFKLSQ